MSPGKCEDYRNGAGGKTKIQRCSKLSEIMKDAGVAKDRSAGDVLNKTQSHERSRKAAADFSNNAGEGVREMDGDASFQQLVKKRFKHCFLLEPIMRGRPNIKPAASSDDFLNEDIISDDGWVGSVQEITQEPENFLGTLAHAASSQATAPDSDENFYGPKKITEVMDLTSKVKKRGKNTIKNVEKTFLSKIGF